MNKQEIITKCIEAYTEAIEVCEKLTLIEAIEWLDEKFLLEGVCVFVHNRLNMDILFSDWVEKNATTTKGYWTNPPIMCVSHAELMESLTTRLGILKKELSIPE